MNRSLLRLVALLLVTPLVTNPVTAIALVVSLSDQPATHPADCFTTQALAEAVVSSRKIHAGIQALIGDLYERLLTPMPVPDPRHPGKLQAFDPTPASRYVVLIYLPVRHAYTWTVGALSGLTRAEAAAIAVQLTRAVQAHLVDKAVHPRTALSEVLSKNPTVIVEYRKNSFEEETRIEGEFDSPHRVRIILDPSLRGDDKAIHHALAFFDPAGWMVHGPKTPQSELTARSWVAMRSPIGQVTEEAFLAAYGTLSLGFTLGHRRREVLLNEFYPKLGVNDENRKAMIWIFRDLLEHVLSQIDRRYGTAVRRTPDRRWKLLTPIPVGNGNGVTYMAPAQTTLTAA